MINVITWLWGDPYPEVYVRKLVDAVRRNLTQPHRFICITDRKRHLPWCEQAFIRREGLPLFAIKGCLGRLRLFDPKWQTELGIRRGERIVNLDLDLVVTGPLDPLFARDGFTILQGINTTNPCPMNGSVWMLRAGERPDVWADFSVAKAATVPYHSFPDDQGWFWHKIPDADAWGPADGVYGFKKVGWPEGDDLPANARVVAFPGWRDPDKFSHIGWVKEHWR